MTTFMDYNNLTINGDVCGSVELPRIAIIGSVLLYAGIRTQYSRVT